ncbi:MAG: MoaD/ThiS family protein [Lysobacter sp.]|jgi:molybdopterin synthase sulfur carrier subunit|nr:MoaD/ThiS family protein [Lysobacter sp.]
MQVTLHLYGAFRQFQHEDVLTLDCPGARTVDDVRSALDAHGRAHWPGFTSGLLRTSAFATEDTLLRAASPLPADGRLAIIPPVSGG